MSELITPLSPQDPPEERIDDALAALLRDHSRSPVLPPSPEKLTQWLSAIVYGREYGLLADLRRPSAVTRARLTAAACAPLEQQRPIYEYTAFLFARYHAGRPRPHAGFGTMGDALRRIGTPGHKGAKDAGACRLLDRLVASRQIPKRHLQHGIERCRAGDVAPPNWTRLVTDLCTWTDRNHDVRYEWARCFYTPTFTNDSGSNLS